MSSNTLGARLRASRCAAKLTVESAARRLKIRAAAIRLYESDKEQPSIRDLARIARGYNRSVDYLVLGGRSRKLVA